MRLPLHVRRRRVPDFGNCNPEMHDPVAVRCALASGCFAPCIRRAARRNTWEGSRPNSDRSSWKSVQFYFDIWGAPLGLA